jgi:hypothetical protein
VEGVKLINKITDCNPIGIRTEGRPKNRWRDEVIQDLKKRKLRHLMQLVEHREACSDLVRKTKTHVGL